MTAEPDSSSSQPRRFGRLALVVVAGLALGIGLVAGAVGAGSDSGSVDLDFTNPTDTTPVVELPTDGPPGTPADTPAEAVAGFLTAEQEGDFRTSFGYLAPHDRATFGSPAGWVADHAKVMPPVQEFEIVAADGTEVVTEVRLEPSLNEIVGLVPGQARITWVVVQEPDGWTIDLTEARIEPRYPPDEDAVATVRAWASSRQACSENPEAQWDRQLLGFPALADELCDADGDVRLGPVSRFRDESEGAVFLSAFGGEVNNWARVVPVTAPVELKAVVAPIGDAWTVIGVLSDAGFGS